MQMQPITVQPGAPAPYGMAQSSPSVLDALDNIDQFTVQQVVEKLEMFTGYESRNRYAVKNNIGRQIFYAQEKSGFCTRCCCRNVGPFELHVKDPNKQMVMLIKRPCKCCTGHCACLICCCACFADEMSIEAPPGNVIGSVRQGQGFCVIKLNVRDDQGHVQLYTRGRYCCRCRCTCCYCCGCRDIKFPIYQDGDQVGQVVKKWGGVGKEVFTDADNYKVTFPMGLDTNTKAGLMAATLLLDYIMFER